MLKPNSYQYVCTSLCEIPSQAISEIRSEICAALGQSVGVMFPAFKRTFPLTVNAMEIHWPKPIAAFDQRNTRWYSYLLIERVDANLYFHITLPETDLDGPYFDQEHAMLPLAWRELYRWFESFSLTDESIRPLTWLNTLSSYSGRMSLEEYRQELGMGKSKTRDFARTIGSDQLMCWMRTDAGDALFLDEKHCDHKVYHVRGAALEDVYVLPDPAGTLDQYLAHYLSGKSPSQFDFRRP